MLNSWALLPNLQSLVYLLLVFRDDEARLSVVDDILYFLSHRVLVGRHGHAAERLCSNHRPVKARAVISDNDKGVVADESKIGKASR